jgi:hypothetical protein
MNDVNGIALMLECSLQREQKLKDDMAGVEAKYETLCRSTTQLFRAIGMHTYVDRATGELKKSYSGSRAEMDPDTINKCIQMGLDFDKILNEIKSNETLFKQWERLLVTMRMVQE